MKRRDLSNTLKVKFRKVVVSDLTENCKSAEKAMWKEKFSKKNVLDMVNVICML